GAERLGNRSATGLALQNLKLRSVQMEWVIHMGVVDDIPVLPLSGPASQVYALHVVDLIVDAEHGAHGRHAGHHGFLVHSPHALMVHTRRALHGWPVPRLHGHVMIHGHDFAEHHFCGTG